MLGGCLQALAQNLVSPKLLPAAPALRVGIAKQNLAFDMGKDPSSESAAPHRHWSKTGKILTIVGAGLIGAGAVLACLPGRPSPEAETAIAAFERFQHNLHDVLAHSTSGKELTERGFACDVELAAEFAVSAAVPVLREDRLMDACYR